MNANIPSAAEVQGWLEPLSVQQLRRLSSVSGVPLTTIWNIRSGETENPRIETVRAIAPHVAAVAAEAA